MGDHFPLFSEAGEVAFVHTMVRDITDHRRVHAELREERILLEERVRLRTQALEVGERTLERILQATPDALLLVDAHGMIRRCNTQASTLFRMTEKELVGSPVERLVPQRSSARHSAHRRKFSEAPEFRAMGDGLDLWALRSDGVEIPVEISLSPVEFGDETQILAVIRDVTRQQLIEEQLKVRQRMIQDTADSLPAQIAFIDKSQHYRYVNSRYAEWFSLDPSFVEDKPMGEVLGEDLYDQLSPGIEAVLRGEHVHDELSMPAPDGTLAVVELNFIPQFDGQDEVSGFVVASTDVTRRVKAETDNRLHLQELAHVSRVISLGELAATLAHEINQPLAAIVSNAQAARRFLDRTPPDLAELDGALDDIAVDAKRGAEVIRRMRRLLSRGEPEKEPVDLPSLVEDTVEMLRSEAIVRRVSVDVEREGDIAPVSGDPTQLQQVMLNLVLNAFDAVCEGAADSGKVVIKTSCSNGRLKVSVSDNGPGLPDGAEQDIFEPFQSTKEKGLGMGLTIARTIVRGHDGQLIAENNPSGGACFSMIIPAAAGAGD